MKRHSLFAMVLGGAATLCLVSMMSDRANAQSLGSSWSYQYDAVGDGSGGTSFDIRGMAMKDAGDRIFVALNGGTPLSGVQWGGVTNGTIGWGDLFFNFSGKSFSTAAAAGQLFGVRFASTNDSSVGLGVYSGVTTKSVATQNSGYSSLQQYYDHGFGMANTQGTALSTQASAIAYYGAGSIQNEIASGTKVADIAMLMSSDLNGLNFGANAGSQTFGFSFAKSALPSGNFLANIFLECGNDGMAFSSATAAPEPTTMAGVALAGAGLAAYRRRRNKQAKSA